MKYVSHKIVLYILLLEKKNICSIERKLGVIARVNTNKKKLNLLLHVQKRTR